MGDFIIMKKRWKEILETLYRGLLFDLRPQRVPYYPPSVYIEVTNHCVQNCEYCLHGIGMTRSKGFMEFDLYRKIIDDLNGKTQLVYLFGQGEPLLHKKLEEMIAYARETGNRVNLATNAVLLTQERMISLINAGLGYLYLSLDSTRPELCAKYKGVSEEVCEKALTNAMTAVELAREYGRPKMTIGLLEYKDFTKYIKEAASFFEEKLKGVGGVSIQDLINMWGASDSDPSLEWYRKIQEKIEKREISEEDFPVCFSPWINFIIYWDGKVNACTYDANAKMVVGDVNNDPFLEIWNNEKSCQVRKWCKERKFDDTGRYGAICRKCNILFSPKENITFSLRHLITYRKYKNIIENYETENRRNPWNYFFIYDFGKKKFVINRRAVYKFNSRLKWKS